MTQTSVSQAIFVVCFLNTEKSGNAVTYILPASQFIKNSSSSIILFGDIGP